MRVFFGMLRGSARPNNSPLKTHKRVGAHTRPLWSSFSSVWAAWLICMSSVWEKSRALLLSLSLSLNTLHSSSSGFCFRSHPWWASLALGWSASASSFVFSHVKFSLGDEESPLTFDIGWYFSSNALFLSVVTCLAGWIYYTGARGSGVLFKEVNGKTNRSLKERTEMSPVFTLFCLFFQSFIQKSQRPGKRCC